MKRRYCQIARLKPEKIEEYKELHADVWQEVLKTISKCNLKNYSIHIKGNIVVSYFEYCGEDYEADMKKMEEDPVTLKWWTFTKPCFERYEDNIFYEDMDEIFYFND